jgi:hypothetical protein
MTNKPDNVGLQLNTFFNEFKAMFTQFINQNSMTLSTLSPSSTIHPTLAIKTLRIAEWNTNGLSNHKSELNQFLQDNNIDVLLVSETHSTDRTVLKIPNYSIYHCNHPNGTAHGGAAILIRKALQNYEVPLIKQTKYKLQLFKSKHGHGPIT